MAQFIFLSAGGEAPPEDERETLMSDWMSYMGGLAATGKLLGGAPLGSNARSLAAADSVQPYDSFSPLAVNGYWIMNVADMEEAIATTNGCPHFRCKGKIDILEIVPMPM